ncbi:MAG: hypothetical protein GYB64_16915 [Chloroflexi bacterium]|nr:hypothetical protein [Chloroflexota bacterium]
MFRRIKIAMTVGLLTAAAVLFTQTAHAAVDLIIAVDSTGFVGQHNAMVLDPAGNPIISYYDATNEALKLAVCNGPICTNPTIRTVDSADNAGLYTSIALAPNGNPVISYLADVGPLPMFPQLRLRLALCDNPTCSSAITRTLDTVDILPVTAVTLDSAGNPVVAYAQDNFIESSLVLAVCDDPTCATWSNNVLEVSSGPFHTDIDLALDSAGNPVISYVLDTDVFVAVCNGITCTSPTFTLVDTVSANLTDSTGLALDSSDHPRISYHDSLTSSTGEVRLAVCDDATCTGPTIRTIASTGGLGAGSDLALDPQGNPVLSFVDDNTAELKLATCSDPTCTAAPTIRTLDGSFIDEKRTALALDATGSPAIAYLLRPSGYLLLYRSYVPAVPNPSFDLPLSAWSVIANDASNGRVCTTNDCAVVFTGSGGMELIRTTVPVETLPFAQWTLSLTLSGLAIPAEGFMGARLEFLDGGSPVTQANCLVADRGTFDATTITCPAATAPAAYDSIRISVGWRDISDGLLFIDAVALDVTN